MPTFDLEKSARRARQRLGDADPRAGRKPRSDRGRSRLDPRTLDCVHRALSGHERPRMRDLLAALDLFCEDLGVSPPSRATVYKLMATAPGPFYQVGDLPAAVQAALYNLAPESEVPGHQVAFYCVNYGDLSAVSFAAGLPWLAVYQALRLRGYRKRSRGLLEAVAKVRRI